MKRLSSTFLLELKGMRSYMLSHSCVNYSGLLSKLSDFNHLSTQTQQNIVVGFCLINPQTHYIVGSYYIADIYYIKATSKSNIESSNHVRDMNLRCDGWSVERALYAPVTDNSFSLTLTRRTSTALGCVALRAQ